MLLTRSGASIGSVQRDGGNDAIRRMKGLRLSDRSISSFDRGLWPTRYSAFERTSLKVQSRHDRRNVPLLWFWHHRNTEEPGGSSPDSSYYEQPDIFRKYDDPVGVHLRIDDTAKAKGKQKGTVETGTEPLTLWLSRVECIRLGEVFQTKDDREATLEVEEQAGHNDGPFARRGFLYIPRAGDVFMFRRKHHRVVQMEPDYERSLSPDGTVMAWKGTCTLFRMDSKAPILLRAKFNPPTSNPVVPRTDGMVQRDVSWPG